MARFHGKVGYAEEYEAEPGIIKNRIIERTHYGTVVQHVRRWVQGPGVNDNLTLTNQISIVADDYAFQHCSAIKYVWFMGARWKAEKVQANRPRIIISLGGVWNGETPGPSY